MCVSAQACVLKCAHQKECVFLCSATIVPSACVCPSAKLEKENG